MKAIAIFLLVVPLCVSAQSEGDVRLSQSTHPNIGRLEIFWKGKWSTFCGLSTGGAQAACRQLGYLDAISYKPFNKVNPDLNIIEAGPETPIAISHTDCEHSFSNGLYHVLRCGYSTDVEKDCSHSNDIVLQCQSTSLWTHPYDTQVRLVTRNSLEDDMITVAPSSGILEIFLNSNWGNVCDDKFSKAAAYSACRQMGYTSASSYSSTSEKSVDIAWLRDISCQGESDKSCDCLSGCFDDTPSSPINCSRDEVVQITCTYDISIENQAPSGSRDICEAKLSSCNGPVEPTKKTSSWSDGAIAGITLAVLAVVIVAIIVGVVVVMVVIPRWRNRGYYQVN